MRATLEVLAPPLMAFLAVDDRAAAEPPICMPRSGDYVLRTDKEKSVCEGDREICKTIKNRIKEHEIVARGKPTLENEFNLQGMWKAESETTIYRSMDRNWCRWLRLAVNKKVLTSLQIDFIPDGSAGRGTQTWEVQETKLAAPVTVARLEQKP